MRHWFSTWKMTSFLGVVIADIFETRTASCNLAWWCNNVSAPTTCWGKQSTTKNEEVKNDSAEDLAFQQIKMERTLLPKGERKARTKKARTKVRTKVAIKARAKAKARTTKVDWTRSPPFRLVLGRSSISSSASLLVFPPLFPYIILITHLAPGSWRRIGPSSSSPPFRLALAWSPSSDAPMRCSCSRSPRFRSVREHRILIWHPPFYPYHNIDHHPGAKVLRPALHHLGWPLFPQSSSPPLRLALEREYPPLTSSLLPSSPHLILLSGRPARRIQSTFLQWSGWASLLAGEEHLRGLWVWARCMLSSLVPLGSQCPGLVKLPCALQSTGMR